MIIKSLKVLVRLVLSMGLISLLAASFAVWPRQVVRAAGIVRYAKPSGLTSGSCATWATACELRYVLAVVAVPGDQIWAAKGTYYPVNPISSADRSVSFGLRNGVAIYGGFAGNETSLRQRKPTANATILSGDINKFGDPTDNTFHVVFSSANDGSAILDGFTIMGGYTNDGPSFPGNSGGGIVLINQSSPVLRHLTIAQNLSSTGGGGVFNLNSNPTMKKVIFFSNHSGTFGGGMDVYGGNPALTDVMFAGNSTGGNGGGMWVFDGAGPVLTNVTFAGNLATNGGGMHNYFYAHPTLVNVTFSGNTASNYGGGMYDDSSTLVLVNTTFSGNIGTVWGGAIYNDNSSNATITNSIFWGNSSEIINVISQSTVIDSIMAGGCPISPKYICANVIDADPMLGPLRGNGGFTQTRALGQESAAIDRGGVNAGCSTRDQRGVKRPQGELCDMGAYEVRTRSFTSAALYDGWVVESGENTNVGGALNGTATTFHVGDNKLRQQLRGLLSFDTSGLPDGATVALAKVTVKQQSILGYSPLITHGNLLIDVRKPYFGPSLGLEPSDFQAAANAPDAGTFSPTLTAGGYTGEIYAAGLPYINKTGTTQLRLRFTLDDDDDSTGDFLALYSGEAATALNRPRLVVYYNP